MGNKAATTSESKSLQINHQMLLNATWAEVNGKKEIRTCMHIDHDSWMKWRSKHTFPNINDELLMIPTWQEHSLNGICGSSGVLTIRYPNYSYLLQQEIQKRAHQGEYFEEEDLWFLLFCLSSAQMEFFKNTKHQLGDIHPANIFLNEDGQIKSTCSLSWPDFTTNYQRAAIKSIGYLSPEQLKKLYLIELESFPDIASEMFSLGLTIIHSGLLTDCSTIYKKEQYMMNWENFDKLMIEWASCSRYSLIFKAVVSNLCSSQPQKRLTLDELWIWISQYEKPIKDKDSFIVNIVPSKIKSTIEQSYNKVGKISSIAPKLNFPPQKITKTVLPIGKLSQNAPVLIKFTPSGCELKQPLSLLQHKDLNQIVEKCDKKKESEDNLVAQKKIIQWQNGIF